MRKVSLVTLLLLLTNINACASEDNYKKCIVEVNSPKISGGFGLSGADWISSFIIQDNIRNNRLNKLLPDLTRITGNGFYFYFYHDCRDKMKWADYYVKSYINYSGRQFNYKTRDVHENEVNSLGIQEMKKW